jgi:hypothetical protein
MKNLLENALERTMKMLLHVSFVAKIMEPKKQKEEEI